MTEVWKSIKGYEGFYKVSNLGKVRSLTRVVSDGRRYKGKLLKFGRTFDGYLRLELADKFGKSKMHSVHRLVAKAFLTNTDQKPQVNHIDGVKSNNVISNLEWCTAFENTQHACDTKLRESYIGETNPKAKLTAIQVKEIKRLLTEKKLSQTQIAKLFGVSRSAISLIKIGKNWNHIQ